MEQFGLLRLEFPSFDKERFCWTIDELKRTRYSLWAMYEDAPSVTHCVSAVRYALEQSIATTFPYYYVWDMCRRILDDRLYQSHLVPIDQGQQWDLVFFYWKTKRYKRWMIHHVWILVDEENFFHSTYGKWWVIEPLLNHIEKGDIATCKVMSSYTDHR